MSLPSPPTAVYVHLDLKGAPPRAPYLCALIPAFRRWGATGLVIEWEDMLPFDGELQVARRANHYTEAEVTEILAAAETAGLHVIPLVQCFGHLEWLLKHAAFDGVCESIVDRQCLRPSADGAMPLVRELLRQVLRLHRGATHVHFGCDEVTDLGKHEVTHAAIAAGEPAYLKHVAALLGHARELGVTALLWHDEIVKTSPEALRAAVGDDLLGCANACVWEYANHEQLDPGIWERLRAFPELWAATAYKGAANPDECWTPLAPRINNQLSWRAAEQRIGAPVHAYILTGWSRFNHLATLCELLPVGLPSLRLCLAALLAGISDEPGRAAALAELGLPPLPLLPQGACAQAAAELPVGADEPFPGYAAFVRVAQLQLNREAVEAAEAEAKIFGPRVTSRAATGILANVRARAQEAQKRLEALREPLRAALTPILYDEDVDEVVRTKLDDLVRRAEACGH